MIRKCFNKIGEGSRDKQLKIGLKNGVKNRKKLSSEKNFTLNKSNNK